MIHRWFVGDLPVIRRWFEVIHRWWAVIWGDACVEFSTLAIKSITVSLKVLNIIANCWRYIANIANTPVPAIGRRGGEGKVHHSFNICPKAPHGPWKHWCNCVEELGRPLYKYVLDNTYCIWRFLIHSFFHHGNTSDSYHRWCPLMEVETVDILLVFLH